MSFKLFVGDIFPELAEVAQNYDCSAELLTAQSLKKIPTLQGVYYTSLADIKSIDEFNNLCFSAEEIFYHPPENWSNDEQQKWTEIILWNVNQHKTVHGLSLSQKENLFLQLSKTPDRIDKDTKQLWTIGCSITAGVGVNSEDSWPVIVSKKLNLPLTNIAQSGSSIIWASYQICQNDIKSGDLVFWGLTSHHRIPVINDDENDLWHITASKLKYTKKIPLEILDNPTLFYHNLMAIKNVHNFCKKVGAHLVILGLIYDWNSFFKIYQIQNFRQYAVWPRASLDLGTDNEHPGPREHQAIAESFIEFYHQLYKV